MIDRLLNKKWFIAVILTTAFIFGFGISFAGLTIYNASFKKQPVNKNGNQNFTSATPAPLNNNVPQKGVYNVLFLGYGGGNHDGTLLTDSIIVIHVDTNTHKAAMISVPRDLWVPGNQKINSVGAISGFNNTGPMITSVTGLPMNYFVAIDFSDFTSLVDNLGGITVKVDQILDDPFYPITGQENNTCGFTNDQIETFKSQYQGFDLERQFTCRYEHLHFDPGPANLDGITALKFVRSRHGDSDFGRSRRQFEVLLGIENKLISLKSLNKIDQTISTLYGMVKTDLDLGTIKSLVQVFGDPNLYKINRIQLTTDNVLTQGFASDGEFILNPKAGGFNFQGVKDYISSQISQ